MIKKYLKKIGKIFRNIPWQKPNQRYIQKIIMVKFE